MAGTWNEVDVARKDNRREIVLTGHEISKRIEDQGFDDDVFSLKGLNFLEISRTCLSTLSPKLGNLENLTDLVLRGNKMVSVPNTIGKLSKLKLLDLSGNELQTLPAELNQLQKLHSANFSCNKLTELPDMSSLNQLHILDISHNLLAAFPEGINNGKLELLAQVSANNNQLKEIPPGLFELPALKILDISDNLLTVIPPEIGDCHKLKDFKYGGNKLKDNRFARMMERCSIKALLDYQRAILEKERKASGGGGGGKGKDKKKKKGKIDNDVEDLTKNLMKVLHFGEEKGLLVTVAENVLGVRQYIVCCVVKHLNMNKTKNMFKRFLTFQTKLHDTTCNKRQAATIATHDLKAVNAPLTYQARSPSSMVLRPLGKAKDTSADLLVKKLRKEAEDFRKEKKRNTLSGIHQYLDLLTGQEQYPCMVDSNGVIISFPPITNCDVTKVSCETTDILIEVTSSTSLETCKTVMAELLQGLLEMGLGCSEAPAPPGAEASGGEEPPTVDLSHSLNSNQVLVLEQVKVMDNRGGLRVVYPSRVDLQGTAYRVDRD